MTGPPLRRPALSENEYDEQRNERDLGRFVEIADGGKVARLRDVPQRYLDCRVGYRSEGESVATRPSQVQDRAADEADAREKHRWCSLNDSRVQMRHGRDPYEYEYCLFERRQRLRAGDSRRRLLGGCGHEVTM